MTDSVRRLLHLDMDAFFASVEQRDDPALRGRPVVVGGSPEGRGVVAAASYEARRHGVRSAMPCREAQRRCPGAVFVRPRMSAYREESARVRAILEQVTDLIEPLSIDEWFLDVTENRWGLPHGVEVARRLRAEIRETTGLTASVGVAPVKFVAKIASDLRKPDGLTVIHPDRLHDFLRPLAVSKLWGVGPATQRRLHALGLHTIGEVADTPRGQLREHLGKQGDWIWRLAQGDDPRPVRTERVRKSRGSERTFADDILDPHVLWESLSAQVDRVCASARAAGERAAGVTLKVRYGDFTTVTRSASLAVATVDPDEIRLVVEQLLERTEAGRRPVRLVGVSLSGFDSGTAAQLELPLEKEDAP